MAMPMTRISAIFILILALSFSGCKKNKPTAAGAKAQTATAESGTPAAPAAIAAGEPAPPEKPDFNATPSPATKAAPAKPAIDLNASVIALCYHNIEDA